MWQQRWLSNSLQCPPWTAVPTQTHGGSPSPQGTKSCPEWVTKTVIRKSRSESATQSPQFITEAFQDGAGKGLLPLLWFSLTSSLSPSPVRPRGSTGCFVAVGDWEPAVP